MSRARVEMGILAVGYGGQMYGGGQCGGGGSSMGDKRR